MKLERTTLGAGANDLLNWLKTIPDLRAYVDTIKESSVTGAQLVQVQSDAPLVAIGVHSEVDRLCLLLQLARVRAKANKTVQGRVLEGTLLY